MFESMCARWRVRRLIRHWEALRERVRGAWDAGAIAPEQEREFLRLQARISAQLPWVEDAVPGDHAQAAHRHVEGITALLTRQRALVTGLPAAEREQFEREWHEHFLFLGELKGMRLAAPVSRAGAGARGRRMSDRVPTGMPRYRRIGPRPLGAALRFVVQLGFLLLLVYVLARGLGAGRGADGRLRLEAPESLGAFWQNLTAGAQSVWLGLGALMQPVVQAYGLTLTLILIGVLVLAVVYGWLGRG
jgi:hypothetical protein